MPPDLFVVDDVLPVLVEPTGLSIYDFNFRAFLPCKHPFGIESIDGVVARVGAVDNYETEFEARRSDGIVLIHTPEEHLRASTLPGWYALIEDLTPKSVWFDAAPPSAAVEATLADLPQGCATDQPSPSKHGDRTVRCRLRARDAGLGKRSHFAMAAGRLPPIH